MGLSEFDIISRFFNQPGLAAEPGLHPAVSLGIGDDCALLQVPAEQELALSMDVLVEGVHFPAQAAAADIARRALAVNLSDLAAMGAQPLGFMLGLTLPDANVAWLEDFTRGLRESAGRYGCPLLGGNLTRGPLQIAIQVQGTVPKGAALTRTGAEAGDLLFVSGALGAAGLALQLLEGQLTDLDQADQTALLDAYYSPEPRLALGQQLRAVASAMLDISDGLLADLGHLAKASGLRAVVHSDQVPIAPVVSRHQSRSAALELALSAGDDYELLFSVAPERVKKLLELAAQCKVKVSCIGELHSGTGVSLTGAVSAPGRSGYDHFARS